MHRLPSAGNLHSVFRIWNVCLLQNRKCIPATNLWRSFRLLRYLSLSRRWNTSENVQLIGITAVWTWSGPCWPVTISSVTKPYRFALNGWCDSLVMFEHMNCVRPDAELWHVLQTTQRCIYRNRLSLLFHAWLPGCPGMYGLRRILTWNVFRVPGRARWAGHVAEGWLATASVTV